MIDVARDIERTLIFYAANVAGDLLSYRMFAFDYFHILGKGARRFSVLTLLVKSCRALVNLNSSIPAVIE